MAMNKETLNSVRQILMNEMGLTRESVRAMVAELVEAEVSKTIKRMNADGTLRTMVENEFKRSMNVGRYPHSSFPEIVAGKAAEFAREYIRDNVSIQLKERENGG